MKVNARKTPGGKEAAADPVSVAGGDGEESIEDPFAVDLFARPAAAGSHAPREHAPPPAAARGPRWDARLPRITARQARLSSAFAAAAPALFPVTAEACARVIARYAGVPREDVVVTLEEVRELATRRAERDTARPPGVWLWLAVEPDGDRLFVEMDAGFCASLVDRAAGGDGGAPDSLRPLTETERAVLEFLWLALVREFNARAGKPLLRLDAVADGPPEWSAAASPGGRPAPAGADDAPAHGLIMSVSVAAAETVGMVRCGLTEGALDALGPSRNPLLARAPAAYEGAGMARVKRLVPGVALRLVCGESEIEAGELAGIEAGDVMVIERSFVGWRVGEFFGNARLRAGDGSGPVIVGELAGSAHGEGAAAGTDAGLAGVGASHILAVKAVFGGDARADAERLKMEDEKTSGPTSEGAAALDALLLTVSVELAARRLGLEDIARLRAGQVLELHCEATDPVDLVVEGRRIARGELVDIEGRLGVRVTHLFGCSAPPAAGRR